MRVTPRPVLNIVSIAALDHILRPHVRWVIALDGLSDEPGFCPQCPRERRICLAPTNRPLLRTGSNAAWTAIGSGIQTSLDAGYRLLSALTGLAARCRGLEKP